MQFCLSCRVSEVKALYWSDIDFDKKLVTIQREVVDGENGEQIIKNQTKSGLSEGNRDFTTDRTGRAGFGHDPEAGEQGQLDLP